MICMDSKISYMTHTYTRQYHRCYDDDIVELLIKLTIFHFIKYNFLQVYMKSTNLFIEIKTSFQHLINYYLNFHIGVLRDFAFRLIIDLK